VRDGLRFLFAIHLSQRDAFHKDTRSFP